MSVYIITPIIIVIITTHYGESLQIWKKKIPNEFKKKNSAGRILTNPVESLIIIKECKSFIKKKKKKDA